MLASAGEFLQGYLWESKGSGNAREVLARKELDEKVIRAFGVGYAPIGPDVLIDHLRRGLGYTIEELLAAGLVTRSVRGRAHAHFRSRLMFPVRDREGRTVGFAGLGTHLGPSWPLWVTSPDTGLYRRSEAVFGLDRAMKRIVASRTALVKADCVEVLRAHQGGATNAVTVHTTGVTREQVEQLANGVRGGVDALAIDLPPGIGTEPAHQPAAPQAAPVAVEERSRGASDPARIPPRHLSVKRLGIVVASAAAATLAWTGAPLLAVWVGSQVQTGRLLSMWGVVTVVASLAALELVLVWALTWLHARYDELTGRPGIATQTSPWHRAWRGDRVEDVRSRYGVSAPERAVASSVAAGILAFEIWFFFFAGSSLASS